VDSTLEGRQDPSQRREERVKTAVTLGGSAAGCRHE